MERQLKILTSAEYADMGTQSGVLRLANDSDAEAVDFTGAQVIELDFPKFTDDRAYSQAVAAASGARSAPSARC